jgi:hypothetical protein
MWIIVGALWPWVFFGLVLRAERNEILTNGYSRRVANIWALGMVTLVGVVAAIAEGVSIILQQDANWLAVGLPMWLVAIAFICVWISVFVRGLHEEDAHYERQSLPFLGRRFVTSLADGFSTSAPGLGAAAQGEERRVSSPALEPPLRRRKQ